MKLGEIARLDGLTLPKCWRKQKYKSEGAANAHLRSLGRSAGVQRENELNAFVCPWCKYWHVGRSRQD
jgi:hypothetical protein